MTILHIANWYPNPWDSIEGNFVRDQIRVFSRVIPAEVVVVQVRTSPGRWPRFERHELDLGARGYFLLARMRPGRVLELLSTLLLLWVLIRERAWRFDALHFHIAYPLLIHVHLWHRLFRKPILISEHWTAYHFNFHLPEGSRGLTAMRRPFQQGFPVLAVSQALLNDVKAFAQRNDFKGFVLPNVVPLHGATVKRRNVPVLFTVKRWVKLKNPLPMLEGLNRAAEDGVAFRLVIGGYGPLLDKMTAFVESSSLHSRTTFTGRMTKPQISEQLAQSDAYLFSSDYETFSIACAEALGAGVPLIGPDIPAIAEYAGTEDWMRVSTRDATGWHAAVCSFLDDLRENKWHRVDIARRAADRFSENALGRHYRQVMKSLGLKFPT
jgi:L-malate glycosyltransferase